MRLSIFSFILQLFIASTLQAQKPHNIKCMHCRYSPDNLKNNKGIVKGRASDECGCEACAEITKKEQVAKKAENDRRLEAALVAEKKKQEAAERERQERIALIDAERKQKAEEEARLKKEAEDAKNRLIALQKQYAEQPKNNNGSSVTVIKELKAFDSFTQKIYGIKLNDSTIFSKRMPASDTSVFFTRLSGTNYFVLQYYFKNKDYTENMLCNSSLLLNMFGEVMTIAGKSIFNSITKKDNTICFQSVDAVLTKQHDKGINGGARMHPTPIYKSMSELVAMHNKISEEQAAAWKAKYANTTGYIITNSSSYLYAGSGNYLVTSDDLTVLKSENGIIYVYL